MAIPLIVEVQLDDSALQSGIDKLLASGQVDAQNAAQFKKTNTELAARPPILEQIFVNTNKITGALTPQQAIYNKLADSVKELSGTARETAIQFLRLTPDALNRGLQATGQTVEELIAKLKVFQSSQKNTVVNFDAATKALKEFIAAANTIPELVIPEVASRPTITGGAGSDVILKAANDQIQQNTALTKQNILSHDKLTVSVTAEQAVFNKLTSSIKTLSGASKDAATQLLSTAPDKIIAGFKDAGVTVDEYVRTLEEASLSSNELTDSSVKLSTEIRDINDQMSKLAHAGLETSDVYKKLELRLSELGKATADQRERFKALTSDTPGLSALQSGVEGLTGAFEVGIGITGLFGDKNKDLEETLIRVNSIMVFAQGAQAVFNTLKKESALMTFLSVAALKAENAQKEIDIALTSESTAVRAGAIAAQKALNAAMAVSPLGLLLVGTAALIVVLGGFINASEKARREQEKLNDADRDSVLLKEHLANLSVNSDLKIANLKAANAKESEITKEQADKLRKEADDTDKEIERRREITRQQRIEREEKASKIIGAFIKGATAPAEFLNELTEGQKKFIADTDALDVENRKRRDQLSLADVTHVKTLNDEKFQIERDFANAVLNEKVAGSKAFFAAERVATNAQLALELKDAGDNEGKKAIARSTAAKKQREIDATERAQQAENAINLETANLLKIQTETRRLNTQISREETQEQIRVIEVRAAAEIAALRELVKQDETFRVEANAKIAVIEAQRIQATEQLQRDQLNREITLLTNNEIARRNVLLSGIEITNKKRLELGIANIEAQAKIDLLSTSLTEDQKLAIVAESEDKKRQLRNASIQQTAEDEIALERNVNAARVAELQRQLQAQATIRAAGTRGNIVALQLNVPKLDLDQQKAAIEELRDFALAENKAQFDANDKQIQGIEAFNKRDAELVAQRVKIRRDAQLQIEGLEKDSADFQKSTNAEILQASFSAGQQVLGFIDGVFQAQEAADQARLDRRRAQVQAELDAGEITAKAAMVRNKELDAQQKQLQREQATRQKEMALFNAIIQTASAVATALTAGPVAGIIAAATAAAIGAAEIAVIAATPIPQFYQGKNQEKGKKERDQYEGWATVGEKGAELWQSGSTTKLIEKSTIVWVKKGDIIYNSSQTANMKAPDRAMMSPVMNAKIPTVIINNQPATLDLKKLEKVVAKKSPVILNIDGFKDFIIDEKNFTEVLNNRRKWQ